MARIIGVADTLDAMTTNRPYQSAMELDYAMNRIRALTGSKFDDVVVTALESAVNAGKAPPQRRRSSRFKVNLPDSSHPLCPQCVWRSLVSSTRVR